jgi:hypothetical protein
MQAAYRGACVIKTNIRKSNHQANVIYTLQRSALISNPTTASLLYPVAHAVKKKGQAPAHMFALMMDKTLGFARVTGAQPGI